MSLGKEFEFLGYLSTNSWGGHVCVSILPVYPVPFEFINNNICLSSDPVAYHANCFLWYLVRKIRRSLETSSLLFRCFFFSFFF